MLSINTNMPSLIAQRSLNNSTKLLNQAIERMTTGFKINHASDNAVNYSISTNMSTKISSYQVAEDNVAMGLDLLSTAGGSLDLISDKLTRLRALAEQSANGTYGEQSLKAINSEANAIVDEIERIYSTAEYNGIKLFGETGGSFIEEVQQRDTSLMTKLSSVDPTQTISSGTYSISTAEELAKLAEMTNAGKIGANTEFVLANNIDLSAYSTGEGWTPIGENGSFFMGVFDGNGYIISNLYINRPNEDCQGLFGRIWGAKIKNVGVEKVNITGKNCVGGLVGDSSTASNLHTNNYTNGTILGVSEVGGLIGRCQYGGGGTNNYSNANVSGTSRIGGIVGYCDTSGFSNSYFVGSVSGSSQVGGIAGYLTAGGTDSCYYDADKNSQNDSSQGVGLTTEEITEKLNSLRGIVSTNITFQVGIDGCSNSQISLETSFQLENIDQLRQIGLSNDSFGVIDNLINLISAKQTEYGAAENRLESAIEEISTQYDNLVSSRSTLRDADIAEVSSEYIRQQILQQASATLMATANQSPALALQLL